MFFIFFVSNVKRFSLEDAKDIVEKIINKINCFVKFPKNLKTRGKFLAQFFVSGAR
jgi:hypothetical protein